MYIINRESQNDDFKKYFNKKFINTNLELSSLACLSEGELIMKHLNLTHETSGNLLDVGCGTGNLMQLISFKTKL